MRKPILITVLILFTFMIYSCSVDEIDTPTQSTIVPETPKVNLTVFTKTITDTLQPQESSALMLEIEGQGDTATGDIGIKR